MKIKLEITIEGICSYVSEAELEEHLDEIAREIQRYAEDCSLDDWHRKITVNYEEQETVDLLISCKRGHLSD